MKHLRRGGTDFRAPIFITSYPLSCRRTAWAVKGPHKEPAAGTYAPPPTSPAEASAWRCGVGVPESQDGGRHRPRREAQPQLVGNPALSPAHQCRHTRGAQAETSPESRSKTGPDLHGPPVTNPISFPSPLSPELMELFKVLRTDFSSHP